jgi:hypothetical protein
MVRVNTREKQRGAKGGEEEGREEKGRGKEVEKGEGPWGGTLRRARASSV